MSDHSKYSLVGQEPFKGQQDTFGTAVQLAASALGWSYQLLRPVQHPLWYATPLLDSAQIRQYRDLKQRQGNRSHYSQHLLLSLKGREAATSENSTNLDTLGTAKS